MQKPSVAGQALAILREVPSGSVLSTSEVKTRFSTSERVARVVARVTQGKLDIAVVRDEDEGRLPVGTVSPQGNASGGGGPAKVKTPAESPDAVPDEGPPESGTHTPLTGERHLFEWTHDGLQRSVVLSEDELREMIRAYVDRAVGGEGQTMQQVAVKHRLTRRDFHRIKSIYGLTKQHEPFTLGDLASVPVDELAEQQLALKRQALAQRVDTEDLAQVRRLAGRWVSLEAGLLDPFREVLAEVTGHEPPIADEQPWEPGEDKHIVFYQGSDLHFGLLVGPEMSLGQETYNRATARKRYLEGLNAAVEHGLRAFGKPDYVLLGVGGDISHVDNIHNNTSSMRHQQDVDGRPETLPREITQLYIDAIDSLLARGLRVYCECIPGNHDELMSRALMASVWAAYRLDKRVRFGNMTASHAFHLYGKTAILGHHGHGESKAVDLASTIDVWLRNHDTSARHRYAITGNLHHFDVEEEAGVIMLQQPSPAASDVWHTLNGYDKARAATFGAYFSPETGLLGVRYIGW